MYPKTMRPRVFPRHEHFIIMVACCSRIIGSSPAIAPPSHRLQLRMTASSFIACHPYLDKDADGSVNCTLNPSEFICLSLDAQAHSYPALPCSPRFTCFQLLTARHFKMHIPHQHDACLTHGSHSVDLWAIWATYRWAAPCSPRCSSVVCQSSIRHCRATCPPLSPLVFLWTTLYPSDSIRSSSQYLEASATARGQSGGNLGQLPPISPSPCNAPTRTGLGAI
ncbi:hypothetical protein B0I35DRAFT_165701 [Stachybotrys elegans]|uniref:Uncharacterized protein n=1 Tax=Stachybotrys elegans TaxID=80388 RepID=A0A8K0T2U5_9HYPO|nr:hypothetical protein B0I35DRAFT_165701 [Stachybotrys elegans]